MIIKERLFKFAALVGVAAVMAFPGRAYAASAMDTINRGIFIGDVDVSGLTAQEARTQVNHYLDNIRNMPIILHVAGGNTVNVTAGELGLTWDNPEAVEAALNMGKQGNVLRRYREASGLQSSGRGHDIHLSFDDKAINKVFDEKCVIYDKPSSNATLKRENGQFIIEGGEPGETLDREASIRTLKALLKNGWTDTKVDVELVVKKDQPKGSREDFEKMKDVLGTFTTKYTSSGASRVANVTTGCKHIDGTILYPGEEFSAYKTVMPFTEENGYKMAGSYLNGQVVESLGGGICQVSTTLYNAVLLAELEVLERHNHSMEVNYVDPSADAAIAESAGKDFRFRNNTDGPIYIEGKTTGDKTITFTIYGKETRDPGRKVSYESEVISEIVPEGDKLIADGGQGIGYFKTQSVHIGKTAKLWKIVTQNGKEVSRTQVNSSTYKAVPRTVVVGVNSPDPNATALMQQAIATGSLDNVKATAGSINSGTPLPGSQPAVPVPAPAPAPAPAPELEVTAVENIVPADPTAAGEALAP